MLSGDLSLDPSEPQDKRPGGYPCTTKPTLLLHEGDRIGSLEVIATPGHTPGHIAFIDTRGRALIAGDAFQTLGGVAVSGTVKLLFPLPALSTWQKGLLTVAQFYRLSSAIMNFFPTGEWLPQTPTHAILSFTRTDVHKGRKDAYRSKSSTPEL